MARIGLRKVLVYFYCRILHFNSSCKQNFKVKSCIDNFSKMYFLFYDRMEYDTLHHFHLIFYLNNV